MESSNSVLTNILGYRNKNGKKISKFDTHQKAFNMITQEEYNSIVQYIQEQLLDKQKPIGYYEERAVPVDHIESLQGLCSYDGWQKTYNAEAVADKAIAEAVQKKREAECDDHYYIAMGKYSGASAMKCQWCGHEINNR